MQMEGVPIRDEYTYGVMMVVAIQKSKTGAYLRQQFIEGLPCQMNNSTFGVKLL